MADYDDSLRPVLQKWCCKWSKVALRKEELFGKWFSGRQSVLTIISGIRRDCTWWCPVKNCMGHQIFT